MENGTKKFILKAAYMKYMKFVLYVIFNKKKVSWEGLMLWHKG